MDNVYTLNPYPLPTQPGTPEHHQKRLVTLLVALIALAAIGVVVYAWDVSNQKAPAPVATINPVDAQTQLSNRMASLLETNQAQASTEQINSMAAILQKSQSKSPPISADKMASLLNK